MLESTRRKTIAGATKDIAKYTPIRISLISWSVSKLPFLLFGVSSLSGGP